MACRRCGGGAKSVPSSTIPLQAFEVSATFGHPRKISVTPTEVFLLNGGFAEPGKIYLLTEPEFRELKESKAPICLST